MRASNKQQQIVDRYIESSKQQGSAKPSASIRVRALIANYLALSSKYLAKYVFVPLHHFKELSAVQIQMLLILYLYHI